MALKDVPVCVTGGAGFIGSSLADALLARGCRVAVIDDLSSGTLDRLAQAQRSKGFSFIEGDVRRAAELDRALEGASWVLHMAANPEVRGTEARVHLEQNVLATFEVLEGMRRHDVGGIAFASTSTVYGDAAVVPTPEDHPCEPVSFYGASKLASEAMVSSYCHLYGLAGVSLRLANVVGPRSGHGVLFDFVRKLREDPSRLEVLGDGTQTKSYVHVDDCVEGVLLAAERAHRPYAAYNLGSDDRVVVTRIAELVAEGMGLGGVRLERTGGVDGGRGWEGDVKLMQLDCSRLKALGWRPRLGSEAALRETLKGVLGKAAATSRGRMTSHR